MNRQIVHFDLDSFFVSVEIKKNSALKGKPVIIGGTGDRGVVASCSYEARRYGIHSAMPARMARQLCPDAVFIKGNYDEYDKHSHEVNQIISGVAPLYEQASIDEFYLDVSGMDKFIGCIKWTQELKQRIIKESGLPISFGLSVNKTVAKVATNEAKPDGALTISQPEVRPFLNPLKVNKIPGVGDKTTYTLRTMGVDYIHRLCQIHPEQLQQVFGKNGLVLHQRAHGIDLTPIEPYTERKSISQEHTFSTDSIDVVMLRDLLTKMVMELAFKLRQERKVTGCINVKLRYSDFETVNQQQAIDYTALDDTLIHKTHELFDRLFEKRKLIRLIGVKLSKLISGYEQIDLFSADTAKYNLLQAMDRIRNRFGDQFITRASTLKKRA
jgi:DNA polymerase-4